MSPQFWFFFKLNFKFFILIKLGQVIKDSVKSLLKYTSVKMPKKLHDITQKYTRNFNKIKMHFRNSEKCLNVEVKLKV